MAYCLKIKQKQQQQQKQQRQKQKQQRLLVRTLGSLIRMWLISSSVTKNARPGRGFMALSKARGALSLLCSFFRKPPPSSPASIAPTAGAAPLTVAEGPRSALRAVNFLLKSF